MKEESLSDKRLIRPVMGSKIGIYPEKDVKEAVENENQLLVLLEKGDLSFPQFYFMRNKIFGSFE